MAKTIDQPGVPRGDFDIDGDFVIDAGTWYGIWGGPVDLPHYLFL